MLQHIPEYKTEYKRYKKWSMYKTEHYVFYFFKKTLAEKDLDFIIKVQEKSFNKISDFLNIKKYNKKISYYIYPSPNKMKELLGFSCYAQSVYEDNSIHILYGRFIKPLGEHEDTHLLSLKLGLSTGFFQEGLAEYMSSREIFNGKSRVYWIKKIIKSDLLDRFEKNFVHNIWMNFPDEETPIYYNLAKYFTDFLIKKIGKKEYFNFYKSINRKSTYLDIKGKIEKYTKTDFTNLKTDFNIYLKSKISK